MNCQHNNIIKNSHETKKIAGAEFKYIADVCKDCGSVLWNKDTEKEYKSWAAANRNIFTIQFSIPEEVRACINEIISPYPNATESHFVRAVVSVILGFVFPNEIVSEAVNNVRKSLTFKRIFESKTRCKMKTRMSPSLYESVESWAQILRITPSKFIEDALIRIVTIFIDRDKSDIWSKEIDRKIDVILMAA